MSWREFQLSTSPGFRGCARGSPRHGPTSPTRPAPAPLLLLALLATWAACLPRHATADDAEYLAMKGSNRSDNDTDAGKVLPHHMSGAGFTPLLGGAQSRGVVGDDILYPVKSVPFPMAHASTIAQTTSGALVAAFFGGTWEKNPDTAIYFCRFENGAWTTPREVAHGHLASQAGTAASAGDVAHAGTKDKAAVPGVASGQVNVTRQVSQPAPTWNPILWQAPDGGQLLLFYKTGPDPRRWKGKLKRSHDEGDTWGPEEDLPGIGPSKNKPLLLPNGTLLCPSSTEHAGWHIHLEATSDLGATWTVGPNFIPSKVSAIQPTFLRHPGGRLQVLVRTRKTNFIFTSHYAPAPVMGPAAPANAHPEAPQQFHLADIGSLLGHAGSAVAGGNSAAGADANAAAPSPSATSSDPSSSINPSSPSSYSPSSSQALPSESPSAVQPATRRSLLASTPATRDTRRSLLESNSSSSPGAAGSSGDWAHWAWSPLTKLPMPNPNSGIDAVTLRDGRHLLVYNHVFSKKSKRFPLQVALSEDGLNWHASVMLEPYKGEFSYPSVIQAADGLVHIVYTWNRATIRHVVLDPAQMIMGRMVNYRLVWPKDWEKH